MTRTQISPDMRLPARGRAQQGHSEAQHPSYKPVSYAAWPNVQVHPPSDNFMYRFGSEPEFRAPPDHHAAAAALGEEDANDYDTGYGNNLLENFMSGQIAGATEIFDSSLGEYENNFAESSTYTLNALPGHYSQTEAHAMITSNSVWAAFAFANNSASEEAYMQLSLEALLNDEEMVGKDRDMSVDVGGACLPQPDPAAQMRRAHRFIQPKLENVVPIAAPPDSTHIHDAGPRGRKRPLSPERRQAARRVRSMRACGRCHALKGRCDTERPCKPCKSRNKRSLDLPCMPELPQDLWTHLFTDELYGHLDLENGGLMEGMPKRAAEPSNTPFWLRLHQHFDKPELKIPVMKFQATDGRELQKSIFPLKANGEQLEVEAQEIWSPPLIPAMNDRVLQKWLDRFHKTIGCWLHTALNRDYDWAAVFFREEHGKPWPRSVLTDVCVYLHQVEWGESKALKSALRSSVLAYTLGHSFYVPHEDIQDALKGTVHESLYTGEFRFVSPLYVDRFIKAMVFPHFRACYGAALKELQIVCGWNKHSKYHRDQILATMIVLLIVAGTQQSKAVEKAVALQRRGLGYDEAQLRVQICEIEEWIVDQIIEIWKYKFPNEIKWAGDDPQDRSFAIRAQIFKLHHKFGASIKEFDHLASLPTNIPEHINERTFGATNIDRILKKFHQAVYPEAAPTS